MTDQTINSCATGSLTNSLLDFWCRAHGYVLKSIGDRVVIIDHGFGDTVWLIEDLASVVSRAGGTAAADLAALRLLSDETYEIRHNPNCPSPFELRTPGVTGLIDREPARVTLNDVGYGHSVSEAALSLKERVQRRAPRGRSPGWSEAATARV
ncbi:hypothetical protein ACVIGB_001145 [Bradyrhizobium sp. USDA 4341]